MTPGNASSIFFRATTIFYIKLQSEPLSTWSHSAGMGVTPVANIVCDVANGVCDVECSLPGCFYDFNYFGGGGGHG